MDDVGDAETKSARLAMAGGSTGGQVHPFMLPLCSPHYAWHPRVTHYPHHESSLGVIPDPQSRRRKPHSANARKTTARPPPQLLELLLSRATGADAGTVTTTAGDAALELFDASVAVTVSVCTPLPSAGLTVQLHAPLPLAVVDPISVPFA